MKKMVALILLMAIVGALGFYLLNPKKPAPVAVEKPISNGDERVIGNSVQGRAIESFTYGNGTTSVVFVGGIHGGYEWNSVLLAYQVMDYLKTNPNEVPKNVTVTIIPSLNPDGVFKVVGKEGRFVEKDASTDKNLLASARFNANSIDLNRNFDCDWKPTSTWQNKTVSAGKNPFSEPEALALKNFVEKNKPKVVIFWHSQANAVYASECGNGPLPETLTIMNAYASAAQYKAVEEFTAYPVTGDSEGWLASIGIPAITVELSSHESIEWDKNLAGIRAILNHYRVNK